MYEYNTRVRYTETNCDGKMRLDAIVDCFQNAFYFEGKDDGLDIRNYKCKGQGWFIYFWQIDIDYYPECGDEITIGTFAYEDKGNTEKRNFYITDTEGNIIVKANSIWSLVDLSNMQIVRLPDKLVNREHREKLDMNYKKRRIRIPTDIIMEETDVHKVNYLEIDSNGHLNNSGFIKFVLSFFDTPLLSEINHICVEYKKQALKDELMHAFISKKRNSFVSIKSNLGEEYALMELTLR